MSETDQMTTAAARQPATFTVREAIAKLVMMEDMDAELYFSFHNSDPIPVSDIVDAGDSQVVMS